MSRKAGFALVVVLLVSCVVGVPSGAEPADPNGLRVVRTRTSLLGVHTWHQQTYKGIDVLDGVVVGHDFSDGETARVDRRRVVSGSPATRAMVSASRARETAGGAAGTADLAILPGEDARLVWSVITSVPAGVERVLVDATSGAVVSRERIEVHAEGSGIVFDPNPVVSLQDRTLRDEDDANAPEFAGAYTAVPLRHLDGSGALRGSFADVGPSADGRRVFEPSLEFHYDRSSSSFSQTMAYYHVTRAQEYIQSLGFFDVNHEPQDVIADAFAADVSFYAPGIDEISLGQGGVDDAEDADIIWHEYGHAIQDDQVPGFGRSADAEAIGEGFSDYWAVTMSQAVNGGYDEPCVADWDFVAFASSGGCLRRIDADLTVADRVGESHFDGQIWSRALWDINQQLGRDATNVIVLESQFLFTPDTSFAAAALATVETATRLFGVQVGRVVSEAFVARGILLRNGRPPREEQPRPLAGPGLREVTRLGNAAPGGTVHIRSFEPYDLTDQSQPLFASDVLPRGQGLFRGAGDAVALSGDAAPGGGVYGLGVLAGPTMNGGGAVAFAYVLDPFTLPFGTNAGVYRTGTDGAVVPLVVPGVTPAPTGDVFLGATEVTSITSAGVVAFGGIVPTVDGIAGDVGVGVFAASSDGVIAPLVVPGDPAPGGGVFDFATEPAMNTRGDVAFAGHVAGRPCDQFSQVVTIGCSRDLFLRAAATGVITRIAGRGDAAPGGGSFRSIHAPVINAVGDVVFRANVVTGAGLRRGVYLARNGRVVALAAFGEPMPGGGRFIGASPQPGNWDINDRGDVAFSAVLDTDSDFDGIRDHGIYRWSNGELALIVRSGMVLDDGSIVIALQPEAFFGAPFPLSGAAINSWRQVLFQATVLDRDRFFFGTVLYLTT